MHSYFLTIARSIRTNISKLFSIVVIMLLGIAFVSGLGTISPMIQTSFGNELRRENAPDLILKSSSDTGFQDEDGDGILDIVDDLLQSRIATSAEGLTMLDSSMFESMDYDMGFPEDMPLTRFYGIPDGMTIAPISIVEGRMPVKSNEVVVERARLDMVQYSVGDTIDLGDVFGTKTVVGIVANPLNFSRYEELDLINLEEIKQIIYMRSQDFVMTVEIIPGVTLDVSFPTTDLYVTLRGSSEYSYFTDGYNDFVKECQESIAAVLGDKYGEIHYLTLEENMSYAYIVNYTGKIDIIALLFPIFFIAVSALVVSTTMTRMVEEERNIIGCYRSLGVPDSKIKLKYLLLSLICGVISLIVGTIVGVYSLPLAIYPAFETTFFCPEMANLMNPAFGLVCGILMILIVLLVTYRVVRKFLKSSPAELLQPLAPKAGKKILFERIPLWKILPFRYKSTIRNLCRYKKNLIMTVLSVAGSTALVFCGFAIIDVANSLPPLDYPGLSDTIVPIAIIIIVFALFLSIFVVYNLTNLNIGERKREIATLMVLGYHNKEVVMYIYREIMIMAGLGLLVGLPIGVLIMYIVLLLLDFGSVSSILVGTYFLTIALVLAFILLTDALLLRKILKVDMSTSLKSVD